MTTVVRLAGIAKVAKASAKSAASAASAGAGAPPPCVLVHHVRDRTRELARAAFPRRRARLLLARDVNEAAAALRGSLVDAVLVDLTGASDAAWSAVALAAEFPTAAFFGLTTARAADGPAVARAAAAGVVDVLVDGVDDAVARDLLLAAGFTARFRAALREPPAALALALPIQRAAWAAIVARAGRPVRTSELAHELGVTREHLSRTFAGAGGANLKRVIDLVRLIAAAELAKNPGHDVRDVATVLEFASSSHLASASQRVVGTKPAALARLRTVDLLERFTHGYARSRAARVAD